MSRILIFSRGAAALVIALLATVAPARAATDPFRDQQWALDRIEAPAAWAKSTGSGVTIAVVDTGVDLDHPDLKSRIATHYDCRNACGAGGDDDHGHGSHVAGIAAAETNNGIGVAGVAPKARIMAVKVLDADGSGSCDDVADGIEWAADHGADVINLSLGPDVTLNVLGLADCLATLQSAVSDAWDAGAVIVAAAGNEALPASFYTGTANLYVVGATGPDDRVASYSNNLVGVDVYAPGGDATGGCDAADCVLSTYKGGQYAFAQGTSMATPHVAGVAALLMAQGLDNDETLDRMTDTADTTPDGERRVNARRATGAPRGGGSSGNGSGSGSNGPSSGSGGSGPRTSRGSTRASPSPARSSPAGGSPEAPGGDLGSAAQDDPPDADLPFPAVGLAALAIGIPLALRWVLRRSRK